MKRLLLFLALFVSATTHAQDVATDSVADVVDASGRVPLAVPAVPVYGDTSNENTAERILFFYSDINIDTAGWVTVTETIRVYANQDQIRRGIFRSIPLFRAERSGRKKRIDIEVKEVLRDGETESYHTKEKDGNFVIYCGSSDVYLEPGKYTYTITYTSRGHVGFFDNYDELYWNITGNEWAYEIQGAAARFHMPPGAVLKQSACYTGESGSKASDCTMRPDADGTPVFYSNKALAPQEGLTAAVAWQKGLIQRPPPPGFWEQLRDEGGLVLGIVGMLYLLYFFYARWNRVGRDARERVLVPMFTPPFRWSPAMMRYVYKRKIDAKGHTAAVIHMAVKKVIRIQEDEEDKYVYRLVKGSADTEVLSKEEKAVYTPLLGGSGKSIRTTNGNHYKFSKAWKDFEQSLKDQVDIKEYYTPNWKAWWQGTWRMLVWLVAYLVLTEGWTVMLPMLFLLPFCAGFLAMFFFGIRLLVRGGGKLEGIFLLIFSLPFIVMCAAFLFFLFKGISIVSMALLLIVMVAYVFYWILIPAYTEKGVEAKAAIAGFRMYLEAAEERRLNIVTPPEHTPELFEQLLPYAIALDLESQWGQKFEGVLAAAGYNPDWYTGQEPYTALSRTLPGSLNRSLASAGTSPDSGRSSGSSGSSSSGSSSWSSGSSGGGSSGGGGGGGGGGGW
ncbi:Predicted membrane protein [Filimonas lacunae]|uniref:Predicted membrane protein n=1 Tax=Filimonas lacunae TaxID=477680 RepID=A0A173MBX9_9BACT|nr:DUF2207 domain-containing protein [Filimonas lacunae]BAV04961.1 membrane protein precursor [Filimonas lacunae]SIT33723.1 Predicted membrane protein [Filimonas lacunae]